MNSSHDPALGNLDPLPTARGEVSIVRVLDRAGKEVDPTVVTPGLESPRMNDAGELMLGDNMVVNLGRQTIAKLLGGQESTPEDWFITKVSFGTGDATPRYSDSTLSPQPEGVTPGGGNEIDLGGPYKKAVDAIDFPGTFLVRFLFSLDYGEGNDQGIVREAGLWSDNETLFARKTFPGIAKSSDHRIEMAWTIRV